MLCWKEKKGGGGYCIYIFGDSVCVTGKVIVIGMLSNTAGHLPG